MVTLQKVTHFAVPVAGTITDISLMLVTKTVAGQDRLLVNIEAPTGFAKQKLSMQDQLDCNGWFFDPLDVRKALAQYDALAEKLDALCNDLRRAGKHPVGWGPMVEV